MRLAGLHLKHRQYARNLVNYLLNIKFFTPERKIRSLRIKKTKHINSIQTNYRPILGTNIHISMIMVNRFGPPPIKTLIQMLKVVSHGNLAQWRIIAHTDTLAQRPALF